MNNCFGVSQHSDLMPWKWNLSSTRWREWRKSKEFSHLSKFIELFFLRSWKQKRAKAMRKVVIKMWKQFSFVLPKVSRVLRNCFEKNSLKLFMGRACWRWHLFLKWSNPVGCAVLSRCWITKTTIFLAWYKTEKKSLYKLGYKRIWLKYQTLRRSISASNKNPAKPA